MKLSEFIKKYGDYEVTEDIKKCIKKSKKHKFKVGEYYWEVEYNGKPAKKMINNSDDLFYYKIIPCFETENECQEFIDIHKDFMEKSLKPDWNDDRQYRWQFEYYDWESELISYSGSCIYQASKYTFESEKVCKELINKWGHKKIAKYILGLDVNVDDYESNE